MRHGQVEIREADGGPTLRGVMIQEGRAATGGRREVFAPGSAEWPATGVGILLAHREAPEIRAVPERQADGRITIQAPATPAIREAVEAGRIFMSVEFHALQERTTRGGVREIQRAYIPDVALVEEPEYDSTLAEVRQRGVMSGAMSLRRAVDCRCGPEGCDAAQVGEIEVSATDLLGYMGDYSKPLGRATATVDGGQLLTSIEVAAGTSYGDDLLALMREGVNPVIRPYPDPAKSRTRKDGRVLVYDLLSIAALIATFTDQRGGFTAATLGEDRENRKGRGRVERLGASESILTPSGRRRVWL